MKSSAKEQKDRRWATTSKKEQKVRRWAATTSSSDVTLSFLNDTDGEGESEEAGSEDEEVDRDDDYDERTEEGAIAKSGEVDILVYIACADETS